MIQNIHIGTSGWSYKHWKDLYYPKEVKQKDWLKYYAESFETTEINGSFYKLPTHDTVLKWMETVPDDFLFCPKMSRYLTHMKKLREPEEPLERFFGIFEPMKKQLGPVLLQLPPQLKFNYDLVEYFFGMLKTQYKAYEFVIEIRHDTWLADDSLNLMAKYEIGLVISQSGNHFPYSEMLTAKNIYIRFHGPKELYASSYSDEELLMFSKLMKKWTKEGHEVWAFFNNDIYGYAPKDAARLKALLKQQRKK